MQATTVIALAARNSQPATSLPAAWTRVCDALELMAAQTKIKAADPEFGFLAVARSELLNLQKANASSQPSVLPQLVFELQVRQHGIVG